MPPGMRGTGRTDYQLLKKGQAALFDEESGKKKATVWRLMGLAKKEAWVNMLSELPPAAQHADGHY